MVKVFLPTACHVEACAQDRSLVIRLCPPAEMFFGCLAIRIYAILERICIFGQHGRASPSSDRRAAREPVYAQTRQTTTTYQVYGQARTLRS
jgi:hypothetical protein